MPALQGNERDDRPTHREVLLMASWGAGSSLRYFTDDDGATVLAGAGVLSARIFLPT
jgi:hypothetical protein